MIACRFINIYEAESFFDEHCKKHKKHMQKNFSWFCDWAPIKKIWNSTQSFELFVHVSNKRIAYRFLSVLSPKFCYHINDTLFSVYLNVNVHVVGWCVSVGKFAMIPLCGCMLRDLSFCFHFEKVKVVPQLTFLHQVIQDIQCNW